MLLFVEVGCRLERGYPHLMRYGAFLLMAAAAIYVVKTNAIDTGPVLFTLRPGNGMHLYDSVVLGIPFLAFAVPSKGWNSRKHGN